MLEFIYSALSGYGIIAALGLFASGVFWIVFRQEIIARHAVKEKILSELREIYRLSKENAFPRSNVSRSFVKTKVERLIQTSDLKFSRRFVKAVEGLETSGSAPADSWQELAKATKREMRAYWIKNLFPF